jgi:hypothetical protein
LHRLGKWLKPDSVLMWLLIFRSFPLFITHDSIIPDGGRQPCLTALNVAILTIPE